MQKYIFHTMCWLCVSLLSLSGCNTEDVKSKDKIATDFLNNGQILLRNQFVFSGDRASSGATTFTAKADGKIIAITARHLLGDAMGISPEVKVENFNKELISWELLEPITNQVKFKVTKLADFDHSPKYDLLKLMIEKVENSGDAVRSLSISKDQANTQENYYLIGCPYSEFECAQNLYHLSFIKENCYEDSSCVYDFAFTGEKIELTGFSGAPIINSKGELVAILIGSDSGGIYAEKYF